MNRLVVVAAVLTAAAIGAIAWTWRRPVRWQGGWL